MANKIIRLSDGADWLFPQAVGVIPKTLGAGDDLNNLYNDYDSGFYRINSGVANSPQDWCRLIVIGGSGCAQLIITPSNLWYRMYTGSPLAWSSWRYLTGTIQS